MQDFQDIISINLDETPVAGRVINSYIKQHTNIILGNSANAEYFKLPGGYVHGVVSGIYKDIKKYDFASHYPSIIRTYNISPDTIVYNPTEEEKKDLIHFECYYEWKKDAGAVILLGKEIEQSDNKEHFEVWFRKDKRGEITNITDELTERRLKYKSEGEVSKATVLKRIINSIYGQLGFKYSKFFNKDCAMAITLIGQYLTKGIIKEIENNNVGNVIMGDTDSFAVDIYPGFTEEDVLNCSQVVFNETVISHNLNNIYSRLEKEADIQKMILFGVKKKYVQLINNKEKSYLNKKEWIHKIYSLPIFNCNFY
jgi:DNA polymerase elongation subunit (family B)